MLDFLFDQLVKLGVFLLLLGVCALDLHFVFLNVNVQINGGKLSFYQLLITINRLNQPMKQNTCGRIVSQRKPQQSLLREYDTNADPNFERINHLKQKYNKSPMPIPVLTTRIKNRPEPAYISDFATQIRQKFVANENEHVKQEIRKVREGEIQEYRRKAKMTNNSISQRLNCIEDELNRWKNGRMRELEQVRELEREKQMREMRRREIEKQRQLESRRKQRQKMIESMVRLPQSMKVSKLQQQYPQQQHPQISIVERTIEQRLHARFPTHKIQQSTVKLLGEFKKQRIFTDQFTIFINRLKDQISLDVDFTQILLSLPVRDREAVKEYIRKYHSSADLEFFSISPIEHDPLQKQAHISYKGSIENIGRKLYEFYIKIQEHFKLKLLHNFHSQTIQTLFLQIGQKQITLGHLISYINMRTGKEFRNRALVKLLKRLEICSHVIDRGVFRKGFVRGC